MARAALPPTATARSRAHRPSGHRLLRALRALPSVAVPSRAAAVLLALITSTACGGPPGTDADVGDALTLGVPPARTLEAPEGGVLVPVLTSVSEARPWGDGWLVLDRATRTLHRLSGDLRLLASSRGGGQGPGELETPAGIVVLEDGIGVVGSRTRRLDLFDDSLRFVDRVPLHVPDCPVSLTQQVVDTGDGAPLLVIRCVALGGSRWILAQLRSPETGVEVLGTMPAPRKLGILVDPFGLRWRERAYLGTLAEGCLDAVTPPSPGDPTAPERLCHPHDRPATMPDSTIDRATRALDLLGGPFVDFSGPLPPVFEVVGTELGPLLRLVTDDERGAAAADLLGPGGLTLRLESSAGVFFPARAGVLLAVDRLEGTELHLLGWDEIGFDPVAHTLSGERDVPVSGRMR